MSDPIKSDLPEGAVDPAAPCSPPPLPAGMTRGDVMDVIQTLYKNAVRWQQSHDPSFGGWPEIVELIAHLNQYGLPAAVTISDLAGYEGQL